MNKELGVEGLENLQKEIRFGDVVENYHASVDSPTRKGFFVKQTKISNVNYLELTDSKGNFWLLVLDEKSKIKISKNKNQNSWSKPIICLSAKQIIDQLKQLPKDEKIYLQTAEGELPLPAKTILSTGHTNKTIITSETF